MGVSSLQVLYPMECQSRPDGKYVTKFTLHERTEREEKPAVRPSAIDRSVSQTDHAFVPALEGIFSFFLSLDLFSSLKACIMDVVVVKVFCSTKAKSQTKRLALLWCKSSTLCLINIR